MQMSLVLQKYKSTIVQNVICRQKKFFFDILKHYQHDPSFYHEFKNFVDYLCFIILFLLVKDPHPATSITL